MANRKACIFCTGLLSVVFVVGFGSALIEAGMRRDYLSGALVLILAWAAAWRALFILWGRP